MNNDPYLRKFQPASASHRVLVEVGINDIDATLGGFPLGITEVFGTAGGGKSTFLYWLVAHFQRHHSHSITRRQVAWIDAENSFDPKYAELLGVDLEGLAVCRPTDMEEAINSIEACIEPRRFHMIAVDSIPALFGEHKGVDIVNCTLEHRLPIWNMQSIKWQKLLVTTNHVVDVERRGDIVFGTPFQPASGVSLRHFAGLSLRIEGCCWMPGECQTNMNWSTRKVRQVVTRKGGSLNIQSSVPVIGEQCRDAVRERQEQLACDRKPSGRGASA